MRLLNLVLFSETFPMFVSVQVHPRTTTNCIASKCVCLDEACCFWGFSPDLCRRYRFSRFVKYLPWVHGQGYELHHSTNNYANLTKAKKPGHEFCNEGCVMSQLTSVQSEILIMIHCGWHECGSMHSAALHSASIFIHCRWTPSLSSRIQMALHSGEV